MNRSMAIPFAIIAGGVIIAAALYLSVPKISSLNAPGPLRVRPVSAKDHILGNPAARAVVVLYADLDSAASRDMDATLHQLIANEGTAGDVALVFRHFPDPRDPNALSHAKAAECAAQAGGEDSFWNFEEALFKALPAAPSEYGAIAGTARVPGQAFASCYASVPAAVTDRINRDRDNALDSGGTSAPYSVILSPGKPPIVIGGSFPYEAVKQGVDEALK